MRFAFDRSLGAGRVAGADEAGRGALAGPLVVAAVCFDHGRLSRAARARMAELDDSKRLAPARRALLAAIVMAEAEQVLIEVASAARIDRSGLHRTNLELLARVLERLSPPPDVALVDGFGLDPARVAHRALVGGDRTSAAVAAASVVAKTIRDRLMRGPANAGHPAYGFDRHVGYATLAHRRALADHGPCRLHRRSFAWTLPGSDGPLEDPVSRT